MQTIREVMTPDVRTCYSSQDIDEVLDTMGDVQIRRVPVIDEQSKQLVGIVSLGDIATRTSGAAEGALDEISSPSEPDRGETRH